MKAGKCPELQPQVYHMIVEPAKLRTPVHL